MSLFQYFERPIVLNSGKSSHFKIEADDLTPEDWDTFARIVASKYQFRESFGIPSGGTRFQEALMPYASTVGIRLIVDDVLTTGGSMERTKSKLGWDDAIGVVIFTRRLFLPHWIHPIFTVGEKFSEFFS